MSQQKAFQDLKNYLTKMTQLTVPESKAPLLLYLAASHSAVSVALLYEKEVQGQKKQFPMYFVSKALSGSKIFYSELEKIAYAVVMSSRKLRHYFEAH